MFTKRDRNLTPEEFQWIIGLVEGEGCFSHSWSKLPTIRVGMTDKDVIYKLNRLWGAGKVYKQNRAKYGTKDIYLTYLCGERAIVWMQAMKPYMGLRRQAKIHEVTMKYIGYKLSVRPRRKNRLDGDWYAKYRANRAAKRKAMCV